MPRASTARCACVPPAGCGGCACSPTPRPACGSGGALRRGDAPVEGYRVKRDGAVVGQTRGRVYVVKLSAGRAHTITVAAVDTRGRVGPSSTVLKIAAGSGAPRAAHPHAVAGNTPPSTPDRLSVSEVSEAGATVQWVPSRAGSARIVGYRVYRDGALVGQSTTNSMRLTHLSAIRTYLIQVAAVDAAHRESARTQPLRLTTTHTPPEGPAVISALRVTDTSATLAWQAGAANSGSLVGYLLYENGVPEHVVAGLGTTVTLASQRHYTFTVRAFDSYGYLSAPAPEVAVFTTHTPPSTPVGLTATEVTASSVPSPGRPQLPSAAPSSATASFVTKSPSGRPPLPG